MRFIFYEGGKKQCQEEVKFPKRQLGNMRAYTKEYMEEKKQEILQRLTNWEGEEKIKKFRQYLD